MACANEVFAIFDWIGSDHFDSYWFIVLKFIFYGRELLK